MKVLRRREDGYHDLSSLFQATQIGDWIDCEISDHDSLTTDHPTLACDSTNLVYKARELFRRKAPCKSSFKIHIEKKIPLGAGVGGGSSNAATTLWALNELTERKISPKELQLWSQELGSDVPFFFSTGSALCEGRGEKVIELAPLCQRWPLWLLVPPWGVSTASVYQKFNPKLGANESSSDLLSLLSEGRLVSVNDLERPAFEVESRLADFKKKLIEQGYKNLFLTGSGSGFIVESEEAPAVDRSIFSSPLFFLNRAPESWYQR